MTLLTTKEVAEYLGIPVKTVHSRSRLGQIPILPRGRKLSFHSKAPRAVYCKELLEMWVEEGRPKDWAYLMDRLREKTLSQRRW